MSRYTNTILFSLFLASNILSSEMGWLPGVYLTKPMLIPLLAWTLVRLKWEQVRWVFFGLLCSWIGDILLMLPIDGFVFGLASFLLAHLFYIRHFWNQWDRKQVPFRVLYAGGVVGYLVPLLILLYPVLGALRSPVILYAGVISTMLLLALHTRRTGYAVGAAFFVLSDSLLAVNKFYTPLPLAGLLVMSTYGLAQYYIVKTSRI